MSAWTILKLIEWTTEYFTKNNIPNPRLDSELLLAHVLNKKRIDLYLSFEKVVSEKDLALFKEYIQRRVKREPLQYITGVQEFYGIPIKVTPDVLIPRPETEILVEQALKLLSSDNDPASVQSCERTILDLCTGSGAIIAALANELPSAKLVGTDISAKALEVARLNTEKWKDRVTLLEGNLFEPLRSGDPASVRAYDIVTANPPYISEADKDNIQPEVKDFEPKEALFAGEDGLAIIKRIINDSPKFLKPNGYLVMEIGDKQVDDVKYMIANNGSYDKVDAVKDYSGIERIIIINVK